MNFDPSEETQLTYIVNENCIRCKYTDCVEVCPVDCFYEGENMLVIHPDECITAVCASRNARWTPSSQTQSPASKSGSTSTANTRRFAQSPVSALPLFRHRSFCVLRPS